MRYISTRAQAPAVGAAQALLAGQAPDGGLYVPESFPVLPGGVEALVGQDLPAILAQLLRLFFGDLGAEVADAAARRCQAHFGGAPIAALVEVGGRWVLELFHGPTAAFKDVALGTLPELLRVTLARQRPAQRLLVLTATSGDTGSAALHGLGDAPGIGTLVFYPAAGISELQRRQMVCCGAAGARPVALRGDFDDAQRAVKALLGDAALAERLAADGVRLGSANSINIGRLVPQVAYHLWTWAELRRRGALAAGEPFETVVPSGNFGNLLAAWWARRLGAPLQRLGCASNANRVLADFWQRGTYDARRALAVTNSPSMDILVSSNLERLLAEVMDDPAALRAAQQQLAQQRHFRVPPPVLARLQQAIYGGWTSPEQTVATMAEVWRRHHYLLDPHTAVAWDLAQRQPASLPVQVVVATASPWKFTGALSAALGLAPSGDEQRDAEAAAAATGQQPPPALRALWQAPVLHQRSCEVSETLSEVLDFARQPW